MSCHFSFLYTFPMMAQSFWIAHERGSSIFSVISMLRNITLAKQTSDAFWTIPSLNIDRNLFTFEASFISEPRSRDVDRQKSTSLLIMKLFFKWLHFIEVEKIWSLSICLFTSTRTFYWDSHVCLCPMLLNRSLHLDFASYTRS